MKVRPIEPCDVQWIRDVHRASGYQFELPEDLLALEDATIVEDDAGEPVAFGYAFLVPEVCLVMDRRGHPLVKLDRLRILHQAMCNNLVQKGYTEAIAHVPPELERSYGRHLVRRFGWLPSWPGFRIRRPERKAG